MKTLSLDIQKHNKPPKEKLENKYTVARFLLSIVSFFGKKYSNVHLILTIKYVVTTFTLAPKINKPFIKELDAGCQGVQNPTLPVGTCSIYSFQQCTVFDSSCSTAKCESNKLLFLFLYCHQKADLQCSSCAFLS